MLCPYTRDLIIYVFPFFMIPNCESQIWMSHFQAHHPFIMNGEITITMHTHPTRRNVTVHVECKYAILCHMYPFQIMANNFNSPYISCQYINHAYINMNLHNQHVSNFFSNNTQKQHTWTNNSPKISLRTAQNSPKKFSSKLPVKVYKFSPRLSENNPGNSVPKNLAFSPKFLGLKCTAVSAPNTSSICMVLKQ